MAIVRKQYHGIKFPFSSGNRDGFFIDLNTDRNDEVASEIAHVILTQRGTRLRMPDFGTDLLKYVFDVNDNTTWNTVESEIRRAVGQYVSNVSIQSANIEMPEDDENSIYLDINYSVNKGDGKENNRTVIKLQ